MMDSLRTNLLADAGAALSPMRLAGEPARIAGMRLAGAPLPTTLAAITWEVTVAWPLLAVTTVIFTALAAPAWWATSAPLLLDRVSSGGPVLAVLVAVLLLAALWAKRWRQQLGGGHFAGRFGTSWRQMPPGPLLASIPLSLINMVTRTALLPALVLTRPDAPEAAVVWYGSFLLIYGQLLLPTPAGAGAVELGFLGGAVGALEGDLALLLAWRWWANGVPVLLGLLVAWQARRQLLDWWPWRVRAIRPDAPHTP
jgi:hypothetical protein